MIKVSVIVPVYNGEKYIRQCLDSIVNQTLKEIEIICVDDGSTDDSIHILEIYQQADSRIHIVRQQNLYAGVARNTGLDKACGEYVIFWDCDDYFALDALEKMYHKAKKHQADICICDAQDFDSESGDLMTHVYLHEPLPEIEVFNINQFKLHFYEITSPVTWNKLILRSLMTDEHIRFQNLKHSNDGVGIFTAMSCAKRIVILKEKLIFYRVNRPDSLMGTYGEKMDSIFLAYRQLHQDLEARGLLKDEEIRRSFQNKVLGIWLFTMKYCNQYTQYQQYYNAMKTEHLPAIGLQNPEQGYIFHVENEEKFYHMCEMQPEEYSFWQYQSLSQKNSANRQRVANLRTKNIKLKENIRLQKEKIAKKQQELKELQKRVNYQDTVLQMKSVRLALKISRFFHRFKRV